MRETQAKQYLKTVLMWLREIAPLSFWCFFRKFEVVGNMSVLPASEQFEHNIVIAIPIAHT